MQQGRWGHSAEKFKGQVFASYIMLRVIWDAAKREKWNKSTVTNRQAGISKELWEELGPDNTILCKKCDLQAASMVKSRLWMCEMEQTREDATACCPKVELCLPGLGVSILATWEIWQRRRYRLNPHWFARSLCAPASRPHVQGRLSVIKALVFEGMQFRD